MAKILYSCIGTTDPVRGMRDGGWMHIMRFYRPGKVYLFLSAEMVRRDREDERISKTLRFIRENWGGYEPEVVRVETAIEDPSDMDALLVPMTALLRRAVEENPGCEVLLNLSSGTPQMQVILAQMALDSRYPTSGIQVKTPERQSGTTARTNTQKYSVDEALGLNQDEERGASNRCSVPEMIAVRREAVRNRLYSLLSQRNYAAIGQMGAELPVRIVKLARHLDYRSRFLPEEAEKEATGLVGMELETGVGDYPKPVYEMIEYFAMLKNLVYLKRYTDFMLRLNPFLVRFQEVLLDEKLKPLGLSRGDLLSEVNGRTKISLAKIRRARPELLDYMERESGRPIEERDISIWTMNAMLAYFGVARSVCGLLSNCERANKKLRNPAAHSLFTITNENIKGVCGMDAETLVTRLETALLDALASYDDKGLKKRINIYDHCDRIIRSCL